MYRVVIAATVVVLLSFPAFAGTVTVDGDVSEWGPTVGDNNTSVWFVNPFVLGSMIEDSSDTAGDGGYVGPNYGGQNYDGEFMGVALDAGMLSIAIVSGQRPDNGLARFGPGDLRIVTTTGTYGIEIGGGLGGGAGTSIFEGDAGSTYNLTSGGYTSGLDPSHNAAQKAGTIWLNPTWILDPITPQGPTQLQMVGGSYIGLADYEFTLDDVTSQHSIIELSFDVTLLNGGITGVYWRPSCGNDELNVLLDSIPTGHVVPLPQGAWLGLFGLGFLGLLGHSKRRRALRAGL